jgi:uncharacterized membrane protein YgaE (UPF0421/DUF939 family)
VAGHAGRRSRAHHAAASLVRVVRRKTVVQPIQLTVRAAAAAALSVALANLLQLPFPIYAMISSVIVTDLESTKTRQFAMPRIGGTVIGTAVGGLLSPVFHGGPPAIFIGVSAAMSLTYLLRLPDAAKVSGYICGIVLLDHRVDQWSYAAFRFAETVLGIVAAVLTSMLPKLIRIDEAESRAA